MVTREERQPVGFFLKRPTRAGERRGLSLQLIFYTFLSKQIAAFVGLEPVEKSSSTKLKFGGISKKGSWIVRYLLGQAGNIAARYDPFLKSFSKRLGQAESRRENGGGAQVGGQIGDYVA